MVENERSYNTMSNVDNHQQPTVDQLQRAVLREITTSVTRTPAVSENTPQNRADSSDNHLGSGISDGWNRECGGD